MNDARIKFGELFTDPQWEGENGKKEQESWKAHLQKLGKGRQLELGEIETSRKTDSGPKYSRLAEALDSIQTDPKGRPNGVIFLTDGLESTTAKDASTDICSPINQTKLRTAIDSLTKAEIHLLLFIYGTNPCPSLKGVRSTLCREHDAYCEQFKIDGPGQVDKWLADRWIRTIEKWVPPMAIQAVLYKGIPDHAFDDAVLVGNDTAWHCSGVALDEHTVLTAAHCLPATRMRTGDGLDQQGTIFPVVDMARAPDPREDLALLRVTEKLPLGFKSRRLIKDTEAPTGVLRYVGFGVTGQNAFGRKKVIDVPASGWGCDGSRVEATGCRPGFELVMAGSGGRDTCSGDSGGPVYELMADRVKCFWRLVAVTSRSVTGAVACGSGGIYTRVDQAETWITRQTSKWAEASAPR